jgi:oligopeptide transport system permease protein
MEFNQELFTPVQEGERISAGIVRPSVTYWQDAWRRFRRNKPALIAAAILLIIILGAIFIPFFYPYTYDQQIRTARNLAPNLQHPSAPTNSVVICSSARSTAPGFRCP